MSSIPDASTLPITKTEDAHVETVERVCNALMRGDVDDARLIAQREYPFVAPTNAGRHISDVDAMRIFLRDRFIDRYSGTRLIYPGALRLLALVMPDEFPTHPHGKLSVSHIIYWELLPSIDHVVPIARGGTDDVSNWVTTSMMRNANKANWTLAELGWTLRDVTTTAEWDGLLSWARAYLDAHPAHRSDNYIVRWERATKRALQRTELTTG